MDDGRGELDELLGRCHTCDCHAVPLHEVAYGAPQTPSWIKGGLPYFSGKGGKEASDRKAREVEKRGEGS